MAQRCAEFTAETLANWPPCADPQVPFELDPVGGAGHPLPQLSEEQLALLALPEPWHVHIKRVPDAVAVDGAP